MTAREVIEQEWDRAEGMHGFNLAAERVIDRLQRRVEELEEQVAMREEALDMKTTASAITMLQRDEERVKRERYRDRLDRGVLHILAGSGYPVRDEYFEVAAQQALEMTIKALAAIDAAVEERK